MSTLDIIYEDSQGGEDQRQLVLCPAVTPSPPPGAGGTGIPPHHHLLGQECYLDLTLPCSLHLSPGYTPRHITLKDIQESRIIRGPAARAPEASGRVTRRRRVYKKEKVLKWSRLANLAAISKCRPFELLQYCTSGQLRLQGRGWIGEREGQRW